MAEDMAATDPTTTEDFLAQRIEELRNKEGWSFGDLSQRMAEVGCPIERSSLQKIERGKPRRKITVNELMAFSMVFKVPIPDLLVSPTYRADEMFLQDLRDGPRLMKEAVVAQCRVNDLIGRMAAACLDPKDGERREQIIRQDATALFLELGGNVHDSTKHDSIKYKFLQEVLRNVSIRKGGQHGEG